MTERQDQAATGADPVAALARQIAERLTTPAPDGGQVDPAMLTALAGQVRGVDEKADAIGADVAQLGQLPAKVQQLSETVSSLSDRVGELAAAPPAALADWLSLGPDEAEERWREISYWVENVLVAGYNLSRKQLPDCWPMHRTAMVHLSWLYAAYRQAYQPRANPILAAEWSTRWLRDGLDALRGDRVAPLVRCKPRSGEPGFHLYSATQEGKAGASRAETDAEKIARLTEQARARSALNFPDPMGKAPATPRVDPKLDPKLEAANDQLAERKWWSDYLEQGRDEDLTWRRARAAAEEEAAR
uniref:hypothetical protein n=1 Tax=Promicromonospora sp. CA-289581 TaxID=3240013 RepID=UPI003F490768